jgi:hypothetical protein
VVRAKFGAGMFAAPPIKRMVDAGTGTGPVAAIIVAETDQSAKGAGTGSESGWQTTLSGMGSRTDN